MDLYGKQSSSLPQKALIVAIEIGLVYLSSQVLFGEPGRAVIQWMHWGPSPDPVRRGALLTFNIVVFLRVALMMFVFLKRRLPLEETLSIPLAFAIYYLGFALFALRTDRPLGLDGCAGIALFAVGSIVNSGAELQRHLWKAGPSHSGHLYTGGLFHWAVHINYFGDVLWVAGYALLCGNPWALLVPTGLLFFFAAYNGPKLDRHLSSHYGSEFLKYRRSTARLIPFLF